MEKGTFLLIGSCGIVTSAWRRIQDAYGCNDDTYGDYLRKEESYLLEDPVRESYGDSCESIYYKGMHGDG